MTIEKETSPTGDARVGAEAGRGRRRRLTLLGALAVIGFVVVVVVSTRNAAVPVGASGSMSMSMPRYAPLQLALHDVDNHLVRLPGGRPGVVLFVQARECQPCVDAVRTAADAVRSGGGHPALTIINVDAGTSRAEVAAFARGAGRPPARYVIDDRLGTLASMLGASGFDTTVVYDARGRIVARPRPELAGLVKAIRLASR